VRKLDDKANTDMILMAVIAGVMFAVSIPIIFSVLGGMDFDNINHQIAENVYGYESSGDLMDSWNNSTVATNASAGLLANINTFYTIAPLYIVIVAAIGIISAILILRTR